MPARISVTVALLRIRVHDPSRFCERRLVSVACDGCVVPDNDPNGSLKSWPFHRTVKWSRWPTCQSPRPRARLVVCLSRMWNVWPGICGGCEKMSKGLRSYSYDAKKSTLSWTIGPPSDPPICWSEYGSTVPDTKSAAVILSSRKYP